MVGLEVCSCLLQLANCSTSVVNLVLSKLCSAPSKNTTAIESLRDEYDGKEFQDRLSRLQNSQRRFPGDMEEWVMSVYLSIRNADENCDENSALNLDRKQCLLLLYKLVRLWDASWFPNRFEREIIETFKPNRVETILSHCLVMDRAQALYLMQLDRNTNEYGIHWYSKLHFKRGSDYSQDYPNDAENWTDRILPNYEGKQSMDRKLFRLLFSQQLGREIGIRNAEGSINWCNSRGNLAHWAMPVEAHPVTHLSHGQDGNLEIGRSESSRLVDRLLFSYGRGA